MHSSSVLGLFAGGEIVDLVLETGAVAKFVLVLLIAFSVLSWAVILSKWRLIGRARRQSVRFVKSFRKAQRMQDIAAVVDQFRPESAGRSIRRRRSRVQASIGNDRKHPQSSGDPALDADRVFRGNYPFGTKSSLVGDHGGSHLRSSDCSEPYGASLTPSMALAPLAPQPCAQSLPEFRRP